MQRVPMQWAKYLQEARQLMDVTRQSFFEGIKYAKAGNHLNDISKAIGAYAAKYRLWYCP